MRKQLSALILAFSFSFMIQGCAYESSAPSTNLLEESVETPQSTASPSPTVTPTPTILAEETKYQLPELTILPLEDYDINEILMAIDCGFVPTEIQGDFVQLITAEQFCSLLKQMMLQKGFTPDSTKQLSEEEKAQPITRLTAASYLYDTVYDMDYQVNHAILTNYASDTNAISPLSLSSKSFSDLKTMNLTKTEKQAINFVINQCDTMSGYRLLEYTPDFRFRPIDAFTRAEAILAVYRLYNSMPEEPHMIPFDEASSHTIPTDLLTKDSTLPDLTIDFLPQYQGVRLKHSSSYHSLSATITKTDIAYLAEQGFNFFQAYFTASSFAAPYFDDENPDLINETCLKQLDQLIAWGIEYDVHINLCIDGILGHGLTLEGSPDETSEVYLLDDSNALNRMVRFFQMLASRYADVSNQFLSFQLFDNVEFSTTSEIRQYILPIVTAIRRVSDDRVIFYDVMDTPDRQKPLTLLAREGVSFLYSLSQERFENNIDTINNFLQESKQTEYSDWSEILYEDVKKVAEKYKVGFMIHGIDTNGLSPLSMEHQYLKTILNQIREENLSWSFGEFGGIGATVLNGDKYDAEYIWDDQHNWYVDEALLHLLKSYQTPH